MSAQTTAAKPSTPAPKKSNTKKIVLLIVGAFLLFLAAGVTIVIIAATVSTQKTQKTANDFVSALTAKDFTKAYEFFSDNLKQTQAYDAFTNSFQSAPFTKECKLNITSRGSSARSGEPTTKRIAGTIECPSASYSTELVFIDVNGQEKLLSYKVSPAQ